MDLILGKHKLNKIFRIKAYKLMLDASSLITVALQTP